MDTSSNTIQNNSLAAYGKSAPQNILRAIHSASQQSGVDFSYLVNQAKAESNFNTDIKAKTSSATGLYQFIDSTWLQMVERYGEDYGIDTEGKSKSEILAMRKDPETSSFMAAAFASENERFLDSHWGGEAGATELYFAHFLGAGGAASFLNSKDENPFQNAADLFPRAAKANKNVFYDSQTGKPRSLAQVYDFFDKKFDTETTVPKPVVQKEPARYASLYSANPNSLSDSVVMLRAQAMRDEANGSARIFRIENNDTANSTISPNLFGLLSKPVDVMFLTQVTKQTHVIRDNA